MAKIRVLLTDDHTLFRQGIRTLLAAEPDMEVVGEAANALDAVALAQQVRPDVVLMDIGMAGMSSFEATRQIRKERPETKVVFLSMYDDEDYLAECIDIGASGYVLKDSPADQLVTAIREVYRGGSYLSPRAAHPAGGRFPHAGRAGPSPAPFRHADQARARDSQDAGGRQIRQGNRRVASISASKPSKRTSST